MSDQPPTPYGPPDGPVPDEDNPERQDVGEDDVADKRRSLLIMAIVTGALAVLVAVVQYLTFLQSPFDPDVYIPPEALAISPVLFVISMNFLVWRAVQPRIRPSAPGRAGVITGTALTLGCSSIVVVFLLIFVMFFTIISASPFGK